MFRNGDFFLLYLISFRYFILFLFLFFLWLMMLMAFFCCLWLAPSIPINGRDLDDPSQGAALIILHWAPESVEIDGALRHRSNRENPSLSRSLSLSLLLSASIFLPLDCSFQSNPMAPLRSFRILSELSQQLREQLKSKSDYSDEMFAIQFQSTRYSKLSGYNQEWISDWLRPGLTLGRSFQPSPGLLWDAGAMPCLRTTPHSSATRRSGTWFIFQDTSTDRLVNEATSKENKKKKTSTTPMCSWLLIFPRRRFLDQLQPTSSAIYTRMAPPSNAPLRHIPTPHLTSRCHGSARNGGVRRNLRSMTSWWPCSLTTENAHWVDVDGSRQGGWGGSGVTREESNKAISGWIVYRRNT